jgi:hypothetical protein
MRRAGKMATNAMAFLAFSALSILGVLGFFGVFGTLANRHFGELLKLRRELVN